MYCGNRTCFKAQVKLLCTRCNSELYCSKRCQVQAFPEHRKTCFELPSLRPIDDNEGFQLNLSTHTINDALQDIQDASSLKAERVKPIKPASLGSASKEKLEKPPKPQSVEKPPQNSVEKTPQNSVIAEPEQTPIKPVEKEIVKEPQSKPQSKILQNFPAPKILQKTKETPTDKEVSKPAVKEATKFFLSDLKVRNLPKEAKVTLLSGDPETKIFQLHECSNAEIIKDIENAITNRIEKDTTKSYAPEVQELVLAKFEACYYRAVCTKKSSQGYHVDYIDYGNSSVVVEQEMKPFDKSLLFDICVHSIFFENFPDEMNDEVVEILGEGVVLIKNVNYSAKDKTYIGRLAGL